VTAWYHQGRKKARLSLRNISLERRYVSKVALATRFPAHGMHEFLSHEII
jgi:hypothetical protein